MAPSSDASVVVQRVPPAGSTTASVALPARLSQALAFFAHMAPLFATGLVYEILRSFFHYRATIHVGDLYALEARLFPVSTARGNVALSEVIAQRTSPWLDAVCGATYFFFLAEVFAIAALLFFRSRKKTLELTLGFFAVNLLGWALWFVYPAAPPWYVDQYGTGPALLDVVSSPAGLSRVDAWLGLPVATTFYSKSANIFGAMPSLHVAYATLAAWVVAPLGGWLRAAAILFALSMGYSAVYLRHHYILDVVAGAALALIVGLFVRVLQQRATTTLENAHES